MDSFFWPGRTAMKHLALLYLVVLVFIGFNISDLDDYTLSFTGPPPRDGDPQLTCRRDGATDSPRRVLDAAGPGGRDLLYTYHLTAGSYTDFAWSGYGVPLPPSITVCNYWKQEVATLRTDGAEHILPPQGQSSLVLAPSSLASKLAWIALENGPWLGCLLLFLVFRRKIAEATRRLIRAPAWRWGSVDGRPWILAALALAAVWLGLLLPGALHFEVGDDPAMEMLSSGYVTGHPSEYLIYINVLLGLVLKGLYTLMPGLPWYPLLLLGTELACLFVIMAVLLQEEVDDRFCWACVFGVVFGLHFLTHLQFTVAGYLAGLLGMVLFARKTSWSSLAAAVAFIVLGSLVRLDALMLVIGTTGLAAWLLCRRTWNQRLIFVGAVLALVWAGQAFDRGYYQRDPGWQAFRDLNAARGGLHMTPKLNYGEANRPVFAHVGWSENDLKLFDADWLYYDPRTYSAEKLAYLNQHLVSNMRPMDVLFSLLVPIAMGPGPVLLFLTLLMHKWGQAGRSRLLILAAIAPALLIIGYLALSARVPERVVVPALFGSSLFLLMATPEAGRTRQALTSELGLPLMFLTLIYLAIGTTIRTAAQSGAAARRLSADLAHLEPYGDKTLIGSINAVILESLPPVGGLAEAEKVPIIHLMWSGGSPALAQQLQRHGITSLYDSMATDPNVWLIIPTAYWQRAGHFSTYRWEHDRRPLRLVPVILSDGKSAVFSRFTVLHAIPDTIP